MNAYFINPPFKSEYGKFSRESRSPAITKSGALYYPLWLIYAAAYLKKTGGSVTFIDAPAKRLSVNDTLSLLASQSPAEKCMFVLDTSTPSIESDIRYAETLKNKFPKSFIVLVGTHPTACYEETVFSSYAIDAIARKEFDITIHQLYNKFCQNQDWTDTPGIVYKDVNGQMVCNNDMEYMTDLDSLPFAAEFIKTELNERDYFFAAATYPSIQIFTGRGCPFQCNFCVYPQTMHGHKFRARSPRNVVDEFEYIAQNFPDVKEVVIEDDTFTIQKKRVAEICNLLIDRKLNKRLKWLCNARADLDLETMILMKKAGCRLIIPGFESGSQEILDNICKGTKIEQIHQYVKNAKKAGLLVHACYMVGNQGETKETMQETLCLALKLKTDTAQFFPLIPYPGTRAYSWAKEHAYISNRYSDYCNEDGSHNTVLNLPELTSEEMIAFCNYARKKYYLSASYFFKKIIQSLSNKDEFVRNWKGFRSLSKSLFNFSNTHGKN